MLSEEAQQYFADETFEYPLIEGSRSTRSWSRSRRYRRRT
jgi:hypothetical protein